MTRELVARAAHPKRGTLALSPELAAILTAEAEIAPLPQSAAPDPFDAASPAPAAVAPSNLADITSLDELRAVVAGCRKCTLCETRRQTVFSDGNATARLVFVGEAPGADEDWQGVPFVGKAGQLLTDIIVKGMKMRREDVYICNVLKCRPPNNRDPLPSEKEQCEPYLVRQLELLKPTVICALGKHAANTLLRKDEATGRLRGKWHQYHGIPLRVTYHPAYLLRNPADKKLVWEDIQHVLRALRGEEDPFADADVSDRGAPLFPE
ncbi:MAG: uracil-DNA glycosylase [Candidatus Hydrogenedentes bacterium]|nr:uracil-DNA glycosylase [Candidatus Hydrogenedentota bacterium]